MNKIVKINLYDKHGDASSNHNSRCATTLDKIPLTAKIVSDGSGTIDLWDEDAICNAMSTSVKLDFLDKCTTKKGKKKLQIAWIREPRELISLHRKELIDSLDNEPQLWFRYFHYILTQDYKLCRSDDRFKFVLGNGFWIKDIGLHDKTKLVSIISSEKSFLSGHKVRRKWFHQLMEDACTRPKNSPIDFFGRGYPTSNISNGIQNKIREIGTKEEALKTYMFSVVIENSMQDTFITEKVMDCFATGTVPIYWGTPRIVEHFNPDGIIFLKNDFEVSQLSRKLYLSKAAAIRENFEIVKKYEIPLDYMLKGLK